MRDAVLKSPPSRRQGWGLPTHLKMLTREWSASRVLRQEVRDSEPLADVEKEYSASGGITLCQEPQKKDEHIPEADADPEKAFGEA